MIPTTEQCFKNYTTEAVRILRKLPQHEINLAFEMLVDAAVKDYHIFIIGNGGSASNASHFAMELGKNGSELFSRIRVQSLNDNVAWMTAIANDTSFGEIFVQPLRCLAHANDILIALSNSGGSVNVMLAAEWAARHKMKVISITGEKPNPLQELADVGVVVPSTNNGHIENVQLFLCHMFIETLQTYKSRGTIDNRKIVISP